VECREKGPSESPESPDQFRNPTLMVMRMMCGESRPSG